MCTREKALNVSALPVKEEGAVWEKAEARADHRVLISHPPQVLKKKRENLKKELNTHILKYFGLDWVIELDKEYEKLIKLSS
jgi:hypothetical protein